MSGNPKGSPWRSTPREKRKRKGMEIMLSDEARAKLDELAGPGMRSAWIEAVIMAAQKPSTKEGA